MRTYLTILALFAAVTLPAVAADTKDTTAPAASDTQTTPAAVADKPAADPVVCKVLEPPLGSRLGNRHVCMSQKQWDLQSREAQDAMQKTRSGYSSGN